MKKKSRKKTSIGMIGLLALGVCVGGSLQGALQGAECHTPSGKAAKEKQNSASKVQHEMVPHVVLPETIQYNKIAKSQRLHPGLDSAGDYGVVSPYVATYTPFPSYQVPAATEFRAVNQSVYPVSPKMQAQPLPKKNEKAAESDDTVMGEKDSPKSDTDVAPILLASGREDVIHATPLSELDNEVTQTGIFCQKPAKQPAAWSFSSPIFKAASVPTGSWGPAGHTGYINQYGPRGCQTQVGFQPIGQPMGAAGMPQPGMMPPMQTFQMGPGAGNPNGPQVQMLPNGMLMVTMPPDHSRCGILRCRCGNQPRTMFLPAAPGGMPAPMQQPAMPADPQAMMMQNMMMGGMQPQMMPVTAMTPYGAMVVGYQPAPMPQQQMMGSPMMGYGMMQAAYARQMMEQMQAQQQMMAQYVAAMQQGTAPAAKSEESADGASEEPKAPLPINNPMFAGMMPGMMADPYAMYSQQMAGAAGQAGEAGQQPCDAGAAQMPMMNPMMFFSPPMMMPQPMMGQGNSFAGMYMTPFGMMNIAPAGGMGMNPMMGYGMMQPGMMPMTYAGYGQQQPMMNQGGMSMSDVIQLVMLLNNNKPERRRGLFARFAERREARRERRHGGGGDDPMAQLMQAWSTPYSPADTVLRMPSRNAYPYGQFGAQVGPQDTANYGGFYNLYMGNTTYPGLY